MKRFLICVFVIITIISFESCGGSCAVEKHAVKFLNLLNDKKPDKAKIKCTDRGDAFLDSCIRNFIDLAITDVYDVRCQINNKIATCEFCCSKDSIKPTFTMIKTKEGGDWCNVCGDWSADDLSGLIQSK